MKITRKDGDEGRIKKENVKNEKLRNELCEKEKRFVKKKANINCCKPFNVNGFEVENMIETTSDKNENLVKKENFNFRQMEDAKIKLDREFPEASGYLRNKPGNLFKFKVRMNKLKLLSLTYTRDINESECMEYSCCFNLKTGCYHFLPSKYQYIVQSASETSEEFFLPTKIVSPLKTKAFKRMKLDIQEMSDDSLSVLLWNPDIVSREREFKELPSEAEYMFKVFSPEMFVEVKRKLDNKTIFSTARGALIASENYFEWSFFLNSMELMGFDELHLKEGHKLLINNEFSSVVPYVIAFDREHKHYHAVKFESIDGPAELQILHSNVIIIRQYHSSSFRIRIFIGPEYNDVKKQIMKHLPHYLPKDSWSYGVHFCQSTTIFNETETILDMNHLLDDANIKSIPFDSHCIHDKLTALVISRNDTETVFDSYNEVVEKLQENNKTLLLHVSFNLIAENTSDVYHQAIESELFLKDDEGVNFAGLYGKNQKVFYLDYFMKSREITDILLTPRWLELQEFLNLTQGIFLHKSFPFDGTANKSLDYLNDFNFKPSNIENYVRNLIPLNLRLNEDEMLIHQLNNYGRKQVEIFETLNHENKFCVTDSYRDDTQCAMLFREFKPSWISFQGIVQKSVFYSLIGMSFYGAEVCGSNHGNIQEDLCIRWYQFAIFTPLFYVKSDKLPLKFTKYAERIMTQAIGPRYSLLSYIRMHLMERQPLLKPLRFEYLDLSEHIEESTKHQFMFGTSLMIAPVTEPLVVELELFFPEQYFEFWSGAAMPRNTSHFSLVMHDIPIFVRAGHIVALNLAYESLSANEASLKPFFLVVALSCTERFTCHSEGKLVVVKNILEFRFEASENHLNITIITENPSKSKNTICDPERLVSNEFLLAKIYGLDEFKPKYLNDYLSLDLNVCDDADWNKTFSFLI
ncbi:CLUMA_CG001745, isoform A [Clunio marinus]|uniref:CLUMA_CG001745, isoform A n=1 Tax=Clunio marinus TaxID=568069 RepID=A0A1J1HIU5_9DIPT|nr:CLUMA_CG001745, isoform A [Clunio marinus]